MVARWELMYDVKVNNRFPVSISFALVELTPVIEAFPRYEYVES